MAKDSPQSKYSEQYILNNIYDQVLKAIAVFGVGWNGQQGQVNNADSLALRLDYDGNSNPIYIGLAAPGTLTSAAFWQIRKLTFDVNNNVTSIKYANGSPSFDQVWDDRVTLTYA
jgi:hypothetical protein